MCNAKAYVERKYIPTDSAVVPGYVYAYTCLCAMLFCVIDSRCFGCFEGVSWGIYRHHDAGLSDVFADRDQGPG